MTEEQRKEFEILSRPLMKWIAYNYHPHSRIVLDSTNAQLFEGVISFNTDDYLHG